MNLDEFSIHLNGRKNESVLENFDLFSELCYSLDYKTMISNEIKSWILNSRRSPPIVSENTLRLRRIGNFVLDLNVFKINLTPDIIGDHQDVLQNFCSNGFYDVYEKKGKDGLEIQKIKSGKFKLGETVSIDGEMNIFVPHSPDIIKFVSLSGFDSPGLRRKYDSKSLKLVGIYAASPALTTIQLATRFLGYYGDEKCIPTLKQLLNHSIYSIQWEAACAITRVSVSDGVEAMKILAASKNTDVSTVANEAIIKMLG